MISAGGQTGVEIVLQNPWPAGMGMEVQTLLLPKPVKKFAPDKDEWAQR
jgi:hypothetical protein